MRHPGVLLCSATLACTLAVSGVMSAVTGDAREVNFAITPDHLAFFDQNTQYRVEPGTCTFLVGPHSVQLQLRTLTVQ